MQIVLEYQTKIKRKVEQKLDVSHLECEILKGAVEALVEHRKEKAT
jgi:hypothetical protein